MTYCRKLAPDLINTSLAVQDVAKPHDNPTYESLGIVPVFLTPFWRWRCFDLDSCVWRTSKNGTARAEERTFMRQADQHSPRSHWAAHRKPARVQDTKEHRVRCKEKQEHGFEKKATITHRYRVGQRAKGLPRVARRVGVRGGLVSGAPRDENAHPRFHGDGKRTRRALHRTSLILDFRLSSPSLFPDRIKTVKSSEQDVGVRVGSHTNPPCKLAPWDGPTAKRPLVHRFGCRKRAVFEGSNQE